MKMPDSEVIWYKESRDPRQRVQEYIHKGLEAIQSQTKAPLLEQYHSKLKTIFVLKSGVKYNNTSYNNRQFTINSLV